MFKRALFLLAVLVPMCLKAQLGMGSWELFPSYSQPDKLIETPDKVYCLSAGSLMSIDKATNEMYNYGINNLLTEAAISNIFYNHLKDYVVVVYKTGNMDVIYPDNRVVNLPDIKYAVMTTVRSVNDVAFVGNKIIVATTFGLVIYDDRKMEVEQSGIYDIDIKFVGATDKFIVGYIESPRQLIIIETDKDINIKDKLTFVTDGLDNCVKGIYGISDGNFIYGTRTYARPLRIRDDKTISLGWLSKPVPEVVNYGYANDNFYIVAPETLWKIDNNLYFADEVAVPEALKGSLIAFWNDVNKVYNADKDGIGRYDISGATPTMLMGKVKGNTLSTNRIGKITFTPSGRMYTSQFGKSEVFSADWIGGSNPPSETSANGKLIQGKINRIDNGVITDVTPTEVVQSFWYGSGNTSYSPTCIMRHNGKVIEDPNDPNVYYTACFWDGLLKVRVNEDGTNVPIVTYQWTNSPFDYTWYTQFNDIDLDGRGNLWTLHCGASKAIHMLPSAKMSKEIADVNDWVKVKDNVDGSISDGFLLACKKSNLVLYTYKYTHKLFVIDTKGTDSPSDDVSYTWSNFIDQDGKLIDVKDIYALTEDNDGKIWIGYNSGVIVLENPSQATNPSMTFNHVKVPRNDGTNYADYLLDGETVICIAVDGVNRKWIGTQTSGAYLVSADGKTIIDNYNTNNSYLPQNTIYAIACDPNSNAVYFGTVTGMVKYNSTAAPAAEDYSEVYAYPNPVRPEYNGWITIKGLMDDSFVKIADSAGNIVFEGRSNGGMIVWDGCNSAGQRVNTGVYYVFASQHGSNSSSAAVTKILVVK